MVWAQERKSLIMNLVRKWNRLLEGHRAPLIFLEAGLGTAIPALGLEMVCTSPGGPSSPPAPATQ